jgi:hypothetical protein
MRLDTIQCDVCGIERKEANHWFVAIVPRGEDSGVPGIAFGPLGVDVSDNPNLGIEHICSQACAHKRLSQWFTALTPTTKGTAA